MLIDTDCIRLVFQATVSRWISRIRSLIPSAPEAHVIELESYKATSPEYSIDKRSIIPPGISARRKKFVWRCLIDPPSLGRHPLHNAGRSLLRSLWTKCRSMVGTGLRLRAHHVGVFDQTFSTTVSTSRLLFDVSPMPDWASSSAAFYSPL